MSSFLTPQQPCLGPEGDGDGLNSNKKEDKVKTGLLVQIDSEEAHNSPRGAGNIDWSLLQAEAGCLAVDIKEGRRNGMIDDLDATCLTDWEALGAEAQRISNTLQLQQQQQANNKTKVSRFKSRVAPSLDKFSPVSHVSPLLLADETMGNANRAAVESLLVSSSPESPVRKPKLKLDAAALETEEAKSVETTPKCAKCSCVRESSSVLGKENAKGATDTSSSSYKSSALTKRAVATPGRKPLVSRNVFSSLAKPAPPPSSSSHGGIKSNRRSLSTRTATPQTVRNNEPHRRAEAQTSSYGFKQKMALATPKRLPAATDRRARTPLRPTAAIATPAKVTAATPSAGGGRRTSLLAAPTPVRAAATNPPGSVKRRSLLATPIRTRPQLSLPPRAAQTPNRGGAAPPPLKTSVLPPSTTTTRSAHYGSLAMTASSSKQATTARKGSCEGNAGSTPPTVRKLNFSAVKRRTSGIPSPVVKRN